MFIWTSSEVQMNKNLPALTDGSLSDYLNEIKKFPMLTSEEEFMLAKAWVDHDDRKSAHRLVTSHLRLAAKIALGYRGYGLPINEVVSEANVGLMQAVKRFDPDKGFRLATYAMWWIKASIQEYILRSWSLVKMGTTSAQKKLFFNLRKAKNRIGVMEDGELHPDNVKSIAENLNVSQEEVISMNRRMGGGDASLNVLVNNNNEGTLEWQDWIEDEDSDHASKFADKQELDSRRTLLKSALTALNQREREILTKRKLIDDPLTLEELSNEYNVSRERIRQIEVRAFEKLQKKMFELAQKVPA
jgi:RNA polymerase sigma-32 factor